MWLSGRTVPSRPVTHLVPRLSSGPLDVTRICLARGAKNPSQFERSPACFVGGTKSPPAHTELPKAGRENRTRPSTPLDPSPELRASFAPMTKHRGCAGGDCGVVFQILRADEKRSALSKTSRNWASPRPKLPVTSTAAFPFGSPYPPDLRMEIWR